MIDLYPHQLQFVDSLRSELTKHKSVLAQAACGFGKTVVASYIAHAAGARNKRILFTVHRRNLITQTAKTFDGFGIRYSYAASGYPMDTARSVIIGSIGTLANRHAHIDADIVVVDEAHLSAASSWQRIIKHYQSKGAHVIGLTATPERLDGKPLGDLYDSMVEGPGMDWLIEHGYLSSYKMYAPSTPDLTGVKSSGKDYTRDSLAERMDTPVITGCAVTHYRKLAMGKRAIAFCCNVAHAQHTADEFTRAGLPSKAISGDMGEAEIKEAIAGLVDGRYMMLATCQLVCEGFDLSAQVGRDVPIECAILLRPTKSLAMYIQQVGRALRRKPEPGIILDHAGNCAVHGLPDDERDWSLAGRLKKPKAANEVQCRICPQCFAAYQGVRCEVCGTDAPKTKREIEQIEGELQEIKRKEQRKAQGQARTLEDLIALGKERGYKNPHGWARRVLSARDN